MPIPAELVNRRPVMPQAPSMVDDHVLIWGAAYATRNLGDMAIALTLATHLRTAFPKAHLTFLTAGSQDQHLSTLDNVSVLNPLRCIRTLLSRLRTGKKLVIAGGVPFQDSATALMKFLLLVHAAKAFDASIVVLAASAMRETFRPWNRWLLRQLLARIDHLSVRERQSRDALANLTSKPIAIVPDLAFSLGKVSCDRAHNRIGVPNKRVIVVGLRNVPSEPAERQRQFGGVEPFNPERFCENLAKTLTAIGKGAIIVFLPMHLDEGDDRIAATVAGKITAPGCQVINITHFITVDAARAIIADADLVIGMRLHTVIFALELGRPTVALAYSLKVKGLMQWAGLEHSVCELTATVDKLTRCFATQLNTALPSQARATITAAKLFLSTILDQPSTYLRFDRPDQQGTPGSANNARLVAGDIDEGARLPLTTTP